MEDDKRADLIQRYLEGSLTEEESKAFEAQLETDPVLSADFAVFQDIEDAFSEEAEAVVQLRESMNMLKEEKKEQTIALQRFPRWGYYAVAAAVALIVFAFYWLNSTETMSYEQLYAENYVKYFPQNIRKGNVQLGSEDSLQARRNWENLLDQYQKGNNTATINMTTQFVQDSVFQIMYKDESGLILANAFMQEGDWVNAIEILETIKDREPEIANWYLGLAYLGSGDQVRTIRSLKEIPKNTTYAPKAEELIQSIQALKE